jgi:hypothetical protein
MNGYSFSAVSVAIHHGMKTSRDNGTFPATFINMVLFLILIAIFCLGNHLRALKISRI